MLEPSPRPTSPNAPTIPRSRLRRTTAALERRYGPQTPPPASGPFELILWELVGELLSDEKRAAVFEALRARVGTTPAAFDDADDKTLMTVASLGGMAAASRARRMRQAAHLAIVEYGGSLEPILALPLAAARRALRRFPSVGEPGADKILLFTRTQPVFAVESNGLRVLLRLGYGGEDANYSRMYRSVLASVSAELPNDIDELIAAALLLRRHGQDTCKRSAPQCEICPLTATCVYFDKRAAVSAERSRGPTSRSPRPAR